MRSLNKLSLWGEGLRPFPLCFVEENDMEVWEKVLAICGGISIVGGAGAWIFKVMRPAFKLEKRVTKLEEKADKDYQLLNNLLQGNKTQNRLLLSLINHQIDGNGIERMKELREELQDEILK